MYKCKYRNFAKMEIRNIGISESDHSSPYRTLVVGSTLKLVSFVNKWRLHKGWGLNSLRVTGPWVFF